MRMTTSLVLFAALCVHVGCSSTTTPSSPASDSGPVEPVDASANDAADVDAAVLGPAFSVSASELSLDDRARPAGQSSAYTASLAPDVTSDGAPSMLLAASDGVGAHEFAATTATHDVGVTMLKKRYRMRVKLKTENATSAWLWLRIDALSVFVLDNMLTPMDRSLAGTHDWREIAIVLDVPDDAIRFAFGSGLAGSGKVWVGAFTFEEVGKDVPTTPHTGGVAR